VKFIYIAGAYRGVTHDYRSYFEIEENINVAKQAAAQLADAGVGFFCPHTHCEHFEVVTPDVSPEFWYELDLRFLEACDAIYLLPSWARSKGAQREKRVAEELRKPVFFHLDDAIKWAQGG
jgi:nucleoside 2-deoxyribosyltransferase